MQKSIALTSEASEDEADRIAEFLREGHAKEGGGVSTSGSSRKRKAASPERGPVPDYHYTKLGRLKDAGIVDANIYCIVTR